MTEPTKSKEYIRPMPATWWMHNRYVFLFMMRELSAVFVGGYAFFLMFMLYRYSQGAAAFQSFYTNVLQNPWSIVLHLVALAFVAYHSVTSWNAAPVLMVVWRGDEKLDPNLIIKANYAAWAVASIVILLVALL